MKNILVEKLSLWQLFILIFIFEIGSAAVVSTGNDAKQDAWIALGVAMIFGLGIGLFFHFLLSRAPGKNLFEIFQLCLGKWMGGALIIMYILYFIYIASRVLRDFCELITSFIFEQTPVEFVAITMVVVIIYMLYLGIEVMGRTSEIFIPYFFSFIIIIGIAVFISGEMEFTNLLPILGEGIKPVVKAVFPQLLTFPFGELIAFTLIIPYTSEFKKSKKIILLAVFASGLILIYNAILQIATLGVQMRARSNFPLLSSAREISLLEFIERVDLIVVFIVMYGIIIKVGVFFYGALKGLELLSKRPYRMHVVPLGAIITFLSVKISDNFAEHIEEGLIVVPMFLHIPFQFILPLLILPILLWKTKKSKEGRE
ncbi:GerAB/ArcD/ProY family transporter [Robertmurraya korlensis]|uniref:GerAB/ArcD/ProY family transporter n=1 Tax=Robertmurraya korlensis TaxID=519977 RepID=UPI000827190E|nr:GerAB/ArcD/ProY family transporter [Robertmurraya korlensis]